MTYKEKFINDLTKFITQLDKKALSDNGTGLRDEIKALRYYRIALSSLHGKQFVPGSESDLLKSVENYVLMLKIKYR